MDTKTRAEFDKTIQLAIEIEQEALHFLDPKSCTKAHTPVERLLLTLAASLHGEDLVTMTMRLGPQMTQEEMTKVFDHYTGLRAAAIGLKG